MIVNTRPGDLSQNTNSLLEKSKQNFIHIPLTKIVKTEPPAEALKHIDNIKAVSYTHLTLPTIA